MIGDKEMIFSSIFLILLCFIIDVKLGMICATVVFAVFIAFVSCQKKEPEQQECYNDDVCDTLQKPTYEPNDISKKTNYSSKNKNCMDQNCWKKNTDPFRVGPTIVNKNMKSINNALQGGANPKTLIPPMITRPCYSLEWRKSNMIVPNVINGESNENLYLSGYLPSGDDNLYEEPTSSRKMKLRPVAATDESPEDVIENYDGDVKYGKTTWSDYVYTPNGYDAKQFEESNFPANSPQGAYTREPLFKDYNTNIFTQTVQPGVYYKDDVIEPINSNIGISFQQQFLPRTYNEIENGLEIVDHDPNFAPVPTSNIEPVIEPSLDNVYDPRMYGYGTSYRNYLDEVTGKPNFPYDDINAVKMPNYIVRSKIDTHNFADRYGSVQNQGTSLNDIRPLAQEAFLQDNLNHRNDMMTRLMRKRNAELWQTRQSPLTKGTSRMVGGK